MKQSGIRVLIGLLLIVASAGATFLTRNWFPVVLLIVTNLILSVHSWKYYKLSIRKAWRSNGLLLTMIISLSLMLNKISTPGESISDAVIVLIIGFLIVLLSYLIEDGKDEKAMETVSGLDRLCHEFSLTARERVIIESVIKGKTNKEIASEHYIAVGTVKKHLENIYRKMDITSRHRLVVMVSEREEA